MESVQLKDNPEIADLLQQAYEIWSKYPYGYRSEGRLIGATDIEPHVIESGNPLNITDLMELLADQLSEDQAIAIARLVVYHQKSTAELIGGCFDGSCKPDSEQVRIATIQAALELNPEYATPHWSGETLYELSVWVVRWLLRLPVTLLLKQSNCEGLSPTGRFHKHHKALELAKGHTRAAA